MNAVAKRIHWQSTPEGRIKLAKAMKQKWAQKRAAGQNTLGKPKKKKIGRPRKVKEEEQSSYIERLNALHQDVDARIEEINEQIAALNEEKLALVRAFKDETFGNG